MEAILALEDGRSFRGRSFGASGERSGEVVFNTSMTGYQEILTDPSYRGQIVVMTCPLIGNYGTNLGDVESEAPQVEGFVVREASARASNWRADRDLEHYLREHRVPGICEIDTRALTRHVRECGAMRGVLSNVDRDVESLVRKAREAPRLADVDHVGRVTRAQAERWNEPREAEWRTVLAAGDAPARMRLVAYDFGIKRNILRLLHESGFDVTVAPATQSAEATLAADPDAVFLSNGPGDPTVPDYAVDAVRGLVGKRPIFGICLGHQIAALAIGADTFKLKFGHHGGNHPVQDLRTGRIAITAQNHGYAVEPESLPAGARVTHTNLNDGTCEGFVMDEAGLFAVQYHPESSPGPHDALGLFSEFRDLVARRSFPNGDDARRSQ